MFEEFIGVVYFVGWVGFNGNGWLIFDDVDCDVDGEFVGWGFFVFGVYVCVGGVYGVDDLVEGDVMDVVVV